MASTLLHLVLLSVGDSGGAVQARHDAGAETIRLRLVSAELPSTDPSPEPGPADRAPEPGVGKQVPKRGGAVVPSEPLQAAREETPADYSDYLPKLYLTVNPEPLSAVEIRAPDIAGKSTVQLELAIFIDEHGKVRRVRAETPGAMEAYVEAASQAFEAVRFKPGEISGRPVKSVIRVVVEFQQP